MYKSLAEEAADLEAVLAERFPGLSAEDRALFCSSALRKIASLYRRGKFVRLEVVDENGVPTGGWQGLLLRGDG